MLETPPGVCRAIQTCYLTRSSPRVYATSFLAFIDEEKEQHKIKWPLQDFKSDFWFTVQWTPLHASGPSSHFMTSGNFCYQCPPLSHSLRMKILLYCFSLSWQNTHNIKWTIFTIFGAKHIHTAVQPSLPSVCRTFSSSQTETLPARYYVPSSPFHQPLATSLVLPVSMCLSIPVTSCKWNQTIQGGAKVGL